MIGLTQSVPNYVSTNGLVAYYPFNGNANDFSGNANHGTSYFTTSTSNRFGVPNTALNFNGCITTSTQTIFIKPKQLL